MGSRGNIFVKIAKLYNRNFFWKTLITVFVAKYTQLNIKEFS